jgi:hypothetical protein
MRVLVCGGRDFRNPTLVYATLDAIHAETPITCIIQGGSRGADSSAWAWADSNLVPDEVFPADWEQHGRAAGPKRNSLMLRDSQPDLVLAFPGGRGTADMVAKAERASVPVRKVGW